MNALVVYESAFGNTEKVARKVGDALGASKEAQVVSVSDYSADMLAGVDLLVVASPTRGFRPIENITAFLKNIPDGALQGKKVAAFDTRIDLQNLKSKVFRFIVSKGGYADKAIAKMLQKKGGQLIEPTAGFLVQDTEGPLVEGELERAAEWAKQIRKKL